MGIGKGSKQPATPVNRQQRRASVKQTQKIKLPDERRPPSVIILMFCMVAILAVFMIGRTCRQELTDPSALPEKEQQEYAISYGDDFASALEEWRARRGDGVSYPVDPVDAYRYMGERPVNPFTGNYAIKAWFRPYAEPIPAEPEASESTTDDDSTESEAEEPELVDVLESLYGNYTYNAVTATPAGAEPIENGGYYLMVYGDGTEHGVDVNMDGKPDRIIGFWVSADAASGQVILEPLKDVLEAEAVPCGDAAVAAGENELQATVNQFYLGQGAEGQPAGDDTEVTDETTEEQTQEQADEPPEE